VAGVLLSPLAMATGPTALLADDDQTGDQHGTGGLEFLDPGLAKPSNQSGMFWYFHLSLPVESVLFVGKVLQLIRKCKKKSPCEEFFLPHESISPTRPLFRPVYLPRIGMERCDVKGGSKLWRVVD